MKTIGFLFMCAGFVPAYITATTTDGMFGLLDYASAIMGFMCACSIMERKFAR